MMINSYLITHNTMMINTYLMTHNTTMTKIVLASQWLPDNTYQCVFIVPTNIILASVISFIYLFIYFILFIYLFHYSISVIYLVKRMHGLQQFGRGLPNGILFTEMECASYVCVCVFIYLHTLTGIESDEYIDGERERVYYQSLTLLFHYLSIYLSISCVRIFQTIMCARILYLITLCVCVCLR